MLVGRNENSSKKLKKRTLSCVFEQTNDQTILAMASTRTKNENEDFIGVDELKELQAKQLKKFEKWVSESKFSEIHSNHYGNVSNNNSLVHFFFCI